ncbi:hypothetical protein H0176_23500 [Methylorubrum populi]|uniref:hypothetical protein n=1 Tax=Methylorubrum rhodesianum TaxID=29427 RepID=UPI00190BCD77|nr:hypothetical protein [Methylorubrum rhodesianum]MBK3406296.1 hypothetical protein [Methylorubrum rhodesianum]MBY0143210.1 hypothetical protein [Methylorubrum populi]
MAEPLPRVPLAPYAPDVASIDASVCAVARNVIPRADGYAPLPGPETITDPLPDLCRGAVTVTSPLFGVPIFFAGTGSRLYRSNGTGGWTDVSNPSRAYGMPADDSWSFALYGSLLVAVHLGAPPQVIDVDSGAAFRDLGASSGFPPPRARHVAVVREYLVLGGLADDRGAVQWSDIGNPESWPLGQQNGHDGDIQAFPDGGAVTAVVGGEFGLVLQERTVRRLDVSGGASVLSFSLLEENRGSVSPSAAVRAGPRVFFVDRDGFHAFPYAGSASVPIGAERVNRTFLDRVDPNRIGATVAIRDATGPRILFAYRLKGAPTSDPSLLGEALLYDWLLDRWTGPITVTLRAGLAAATPAVSIDSIAGSVDDPGQLSFDDPSYAGGVPALGYITADNRLALLTGAPLEALIETADIMPFRPDRAFVRGVRLDTDADDWRIAVGGRETLKRADQVAYKPETDPTVERFAPCRVSARYHRARIRIPAGTDWTYAVGVEPDATRDGSR